MTDQKPTTVGGDAQDKKPEDVKRTDKMVKLESDEEAEYHPARSIATNVQRLYAENLSRDKRETINKGFEGVMNMTPESLKQALFFFTTADVDKTCDNIDTAFNTMVKNERVRTAMNLGEDSVQKVLDAKEYTVEVYEDSLEKTTATVKDTWGSVWGIGEMLVNTTKTKVQETTDYVVETKDFIYDTTVDKVTVTTQLAYDAKNYLANTEYSTIKDDTIKLTEQKYGEAKEFVGEKYNETTTALGEKYNETTKYVEDTYEDTKKYVVDTKDALVDTSVATAEDTKQYVYTGWAASLSFTTETLDSLRESLNAYLPIAINAKNKDKLLANVSEYYEDVTEKTTTPAYEGVEFVRKQGLTALLGSTTGFLYHATGFSKDEEKYGPVVDRVKDLAKSIFNVRVLVAMGEDDG